MAHQYHNLSLRLYDTLDWVGASDQMRDKYRETSIASELAAHMISNKFLSDIKGLAYHFGSYCEGTTTPGLNSDTDTLYCRQYPVVERISDAPKHGLAFLMVADETTKPGYFKLQRVNNARPCYYTITQECFGIDQHNRICLFNCYEFDKSLAEILPNVNGPARTRTGMNGLHDVDLVIAYQCQHIPSFAKSRLRRVITCNRLNDTQKHLLKGFGCFFVGKNHPLSENGPIEWRLSFSLHERELMFSLNSTQHKCYILLKIIRKDIIHKRVPDSISSYHCKTCLLYAVEYTPSEFWIRRNLLNCTFLCIKLLLQWVKEQYCPNYFMPNENMFDRLECRTLRQLQVVLEDMADNWCSFLWSVTCDDIGKVLHSAFFGYRTSIFREANSRVSETSMLCNITTHRILMMHIRREIAVLKSTSALHVLSTLHSLQTHLLSTACVRDHTEADTKQAIRYIIPKVRLQIAQCVASIMLSTSDADRLNVFDTLKYYIQESKDCDVNSANLIVASYCLQSERYDVCEKILLQCETFFKSHVISLCGCMYGRGYVWSEAINESIRMFGSQNIQYTKFARTYLTACLAFLPHQANLVPPALHYEMYRSVNTPPDSSVKGHAFSFDWIVVDPKVYMYFLQYVLYSKMNRPVCKKGAIDNLIRIIETEKNLGHKETAFNLLGWIFKQENNIQRAMVCFLRSWRIRPNHNAAKWHALEMIFSLSRSSNHGHR